MTAVLKLPVTILGAGTKTINDLPFDRTNLAFWVNGNGAPPMAAYADRIDYLLDRANAAHYLPAGSARILVPGVVNNIAVCDSRFNTAGSVSGAAGYPIPTSFIGSKVAVAGITKRGAAATDTLNSILFVGTAANTDTVFLLRYYLSGFDFVIRRSPGEASPTIRVVVEPTKFDYFLVEVDYATGAVTVNVNGNIVQAVLASTGAPALPASPVAMIAGLSVNQLRGVMSDLMGFNNGLGAAQKTELLTYLAAKQAALNAV